MIWLYALFFLAAIGKWADVAFLQSVSWWWILLPLLVTIAWFEVFERMLGFDQKRKLQESAYEKAKKLRIKKQLEQSSRR